ncbi:uncharacterized protein LOC106868589 isoform X1 [Octopus bimaculoides]|uniref:uncharacterized protein LOC106868589 isoform X1 n=1 Tax=Octopus bimaculoides TaxID=37653 RepID=UPI00071D29E1|nr:uncharacterized protein LOC106868589 isoform X1 [Octopus bimaculoides]XP_052827907.1 uncharacterized protein LOC106868589 isoform X1 [Octopus bimaculoides]|eukprot:XP_014769405.1 PREDICTED: uncharacterized protein LOC106868589 [Octopus bimaculoides]
MSASSVLGDETSATISDFEESSQVITTSEDNDEDIYLSNNTELHPNESLPNANHSASIKWQQKLFKLYGNEADVFINPTQKSKKFVHPKMLEIGGSTGSGPLFSVLRQESIRKLLKQDENLSTELKNTYDAYVHQCSALNRKPVQRVFCAEDIEDKYSFYKKKPKYAKKKQIVNIMYELCQKHQDSATICVYNNPFPDLNNRYGTGESAVARYIPGYNSNSGLPTPQLAVTLDEKPSLMKGHSFSELNENEEKDYTETSNKTDNSSEDNNGQPVAFRRNTKVYYLPDKSDYKAQFFCLNSNFTPDLKCITPTKEIKLDSTKLLFKGNIYY